MDVRQLTLQQMVALLLTYLTVENLLFKFVGNNRRTNIFCTPISETGIMETISSSPKKFMHSIQHTWMKYTGLNLLPIASFGSVEFRHMPGTNNINKLLAWVDLITRLKQFVYRFEYADIVSTIMALNSNSRYRQYVDLIFDDMTSYLDTSNLLADMEKPVYLAKNCAVVNAFHNEVIKPDKFNTPSMLLDKVGSWMDKLTREQSSALIEFCDIFGLEYERTFRDIVSRPKTYISAHPQHEVLIRCIADMTKKSLPPGGF
jgi:hypothetical protein